jgi:hypothetical protein
VDISIGRDGSDLGISLATTDDERLIELTWAISSLVVISRLLASKISKTLSTAF